MAATASWRIFILGWLFLPAAFAWAGAPFSYDSTPGQLPKSVCPTQYTIRLEPDLEKFTAHGTETIEILVLKPVKEIVLNALDLEISSARLVAGREMELHPLLDASKQTLTLPLPEELHPGKYKLEIEFSCRITAQAQGLYYVKYATKSGKKLMLGTQMEPADARRMFPCWDEPVFRAGFQLTVVVPEKHLPVSNMPVEKERKIGRGMKEVQFARTPPMASYLVVLVSGEFEELKGQAEGVPLRIITTEGKREQARFALETTKQVLAYYNRYFGIRYPMPKLDQIAVPGGFGGAMENWGAITYNERNILVNPAATSLGERQNIYGVIAHEMAHQWFGDLVTTAWWDDLWLNEGFASFLSAKVTDQLNPSWEVSLNAAAVMNSVMEDDARSATHPILRPVKNESAANDAFDHITYQKGQSFLRMLENFLGENAFRTGLHQFLADHEYSSATTADLWTALEKSSGKPVRALASGWTGQPGLPLVVVQTNCAGNRQVVTLSQQRFSVNDSNAAPLSWMIPIALEDASHPQTRGFALLNSNTVSVPFLDCASLVKANAGNFGYYRTAYEAGILRKLRENLGNLPAPDRLNLLADAWALVESGQGDISNYLDLASSLQSEKTWAVLNQVYSSFDFIDSLERGEAGQKLWRNFASAALRPSLNRLGWTVRPGEAPNDALIRSRVIGCLGTYGDAEVIAQCQARFEKFLAKPSTLSADLRGPVLTIVGRYADRTTYDQLHELARTAPTLEERQLYYRAMAGANDPELALLTLSIALTDETLPQETANLVPQVAQTSDQTALAWDFARRHLKELLGQIESFRRNGYVPGIMGAFNEAARADELEDFVKANLGADALSKAHEAAEGIRFKADFKRRELEAIDRWVAAHQP